MLTDPNEIVIVVKGPHNVNVILKYFMLLDIQPWRGAVPAAFVPSDHG